jgi:hypothetical protein
LQKKGIKFEWKKKCEENFNLLKELLTSAPIVNIVDPNESFVVCIDACKEEIGGDLTHNGYVINHESRMLKEHYRNYATHDDPGGSRWPPTLFNWLKTVFLATYYF